MIESMIKSKGINCHGSEKWVTILGKQLASIRRQREPEIILEISDREQMTGKRQSIERWKEAFTEKTSIKRAANVIRLLPQSNAMVPNDSHFHVLSYVVS